jgi:hypothetical protein
VRLAFAAFLRSFDCRFRSLRDIAGWRAAFDRTPAAASAHATQYGCSLRPNEYTRHSVQKLKPQFRHVSTASSKPCRSHRTSMSRQPFALRRHIGLNPDRPLPSPTGVIRRFPVAPLRIANDLASKWFDRPTELQP